MDHQSKAALLETLSKHEASLQEAGVHWNNQKKIAWLADLPWDEQAKNTVMQTLEQTAFKEFQSNGQSKKHVIGYTQESVPGQNMFEQIKELLVIGCYPVFHDICNLHTIDKTAKMSRPSLNQALSCLYPEQNDLFVVWGIDRLAVLRISQVEIIKQIIKKNINFCSLTNPIMAGPITEKRLHADRLRWGVIISFTELLDSEREALVNNHQHPILIEIAQDLLTLTRQYLDESKFPDEEVKRTIFSISEKPDFYRQLNFEIKMLGKNDQIKDLLDLGKHIEQQIGTLYC